MKSEYWVKSVRHGFMFCAGERRFASAEALLAWVKKYHPGDLRRATKAMDQ